MGICVGLQWSKSNGDSVQEVVIVLSGVGIYNGGGQAAVVSVSAKRKSSNFKQRNILGFVCRALETYDITILDLRLVKCLFRLHWLDHRMLDLLIGIISTGVAN